MSFTDTDFLSTVLDQVKEYLGGVFTDAGRPIDDRRRTPGRPIWDAEMLAVWPRTKLVDPRTDLATDIVRDPMRHGLDVGILLVRCATAVNPRERTGIPLGRQVDEDGVAYATDLWILQRGLLLGIQSGRLVPTTCTVARMQPIQPETQQQFSGMSTTVEVALG